MSDSQIEWHSAADDLLYKLDMRGLIGVVRLPDGKILGLTRQNQVIAFENGRFVATWQPDRVLASSPMLLGKALVFLTQDNRVVSYTIDGKLAWNTEPFNYRLEQVVQSGDLLALASGEQDNNYRLWLINSSGKVVYQGAAPAPIVPVAIPGGGFVVLVASQINRVGADASLVALFDAGQALLRSSNAVIDPVGNVYVYPGRGKDLIAYAPNGAIRWKSEFPSPILQTPLLAVGKGCLVYTLLHDGRLIAFDARDGATRGMASLYAGGVHNHPAARFLTVRLNEQVQFSAGYLSIATLDGLTLTGLDKCG